MPISTNLNIDPYFDDFEESSKYYRILFKPDVAVQARELTQLQTIQQNQIEQFGNNIYKEGSIIRGCTFTELDDLKYVKIGDSITSSDSSGRNKPSEFLPKTEVISDTVSREYYYVLESSNGLSALIVSAADGYVSRAPDLNTFFIRYLNSSNADDQIFANGAVLSIREYYTKVTQTAIGETDVPDEVIDNGIVATTSVATFSSPTGNSFGLTVSEGVIFQKGHFLYVDNQTIIVTKYITDPLSDPRLPDGRSVGFIVDERIITSQQDESLLDNATGFPNEQAPGADRLFLSPRLVAINTSAETSTETFFALIRYENGQAVTIRDVTQFNSIAKEAALQVSEMHGDFAVEPFNYDIKRIGGDLVATISQGIVYANGFRITNRAERRFVIDDLDTDDDVLTAQNQPIKIDDGAYYSITAANGTVDIENFGTVNLLDANNSVVGVASIKNITSDRLYIMGQRFENGHNASEVVSVEDSTGGSGKIFVDPLLKGANEYSLVYDTGQFNLKSVNDLSLSIRRQDTTVIDANGDIFINAPGGYTFDDDSLNDILVVNDSDQPVTVTGSSANTSVLIINTGSAADNCTVYYSIKLTTAESRPKQLRTVFVKFVYDEDQDFYGLGLPDVNKIISIKDNATDIDYKNSFKFYRRQTPNFYDHAALGYISGRAAPPDAATMVVELEVFYAEFSTTVLNFFDVNSYSSIDPYDIPVFESHNGKRYALRDCIDFRPYRQPEVSYANTAGSADTYTNTTPFKYPSANTDLFDDSYFWAAPAPGSSGSVDYTFYLPRKDILVVDTNGDFSLIKGSPSAKPKAPSPGKKKVLATVNIPGYPGLTADEADTRGFIDYEVTVSGDMDKTYTMSDIAAIDRSVDTLRYYVTLNLLENSTKDLLIQDASGLNRFKNGFIADPFEDLSGCNIDDKDWNATLDPGRKTLTPAQNLVQANLKLTSTGSSNVSIWGTDSSLATLLSNAETVAISQPYATNYRTCAQGAYLYVGRGQISPEKSQSYAHNTNYKKVKEIREDVSKNKITANENGSKYYKITTPVRSNSNIQDTPSGGVIGTNWNTSLTQYYDAQSSKQISNGSSEEGYVQSVYFRPYMKSNKIAIQLFGLRPNTRHHFFFDGKNVDEYIKPAKFVNGKFSQYGSFGDEVRTDSTGKLIAFFKIPNKTFTVGDKTLQVFDVDNWADRETASSRSRPLTYSAYNIGISHKGQTPSTRTVVAEQDESITNKSVSLKAVDQSERENSSISQTFFIKRSMTGEAECLYASQLQLYFKRKGTAGITVSIHEVQNGYPSNEVVPFSSVHLDAADVEVDSKATVATIFEFSGPVRLDTEKEYAIVVKPDGDDPDYIIYTSHTGRKNLEDNAVVTQDWGDGNLFASTNGKAWVAYQNEDIKFSLYRYNFNVSEGDLLLEVADMEFLSVNTPTVEFIEDEFVYTLGTTISDGSTIVIDANTATLTGNGCVNYNVGDYVYFESGSEKELLKVVQDNGSEELIVDRAPNFSGSFTTLYTPVVGKVNSYNPVESKELILEDSSARSGRVFQANNTIYGLESGSETTISSIENKEFGYGQLMLDYIADSKSSASATGLAIYPANTELSPYEFNIEFDDDCNFSHNGCIIFSKSNDVTSSKNLKIKAKLKRDNSVLCKTTSPLVDIETGIINLYYFDEVYSNSSNSNIMGSYVSGTVTLESGFESEDLHLWVSAHRPKGTSLSAWVRVRNHADDSRLEENDWIQLELENQLEYANRYSAILNEDDWIEFKYVVPDSVKTNDILTYTNENGEFSSFVQFDLKIELGSETKYRWVTLKDIRAVAFE